MTASPEFWQTIEPPGSHATHGPFIDSYPATLPDGRQLLLPLRVLPGSGDRGVAGLIVNQASFAVFDALSSALLDVVRPFDPDLVVGVPTLGLPLAEAVARGLGHRRFVPLSTSRKFWYDDGLAEVLASVTTPERRKSLYIDPRLLPRLEARQRVVVIDDVVSSGQSLTATLKLLRRIGAAPIAVGVVMEQGQLWRAALAEHDPAWPQLVRSVFTSPLLRRDGDGWVVAD